MTTHNEEQNPQFPRKRGMSKFGWSLFIVFFIGLIAFNIPMPYFLIQPGTAEEIRPMIKVTGGYTNEKGTFMLTTVLLGKANLLTYGYAKINSGNIDTYPQEEILARGESSEEYNQRQELVMKNSQDIATLVAFRHANVPVKVVPLGVVVTMLVEGMPAEKVLHIGDRIKAVNGKTIQKAIELVNTVKGKKAGDKISVTFVHNDQVQTAEIALQEFNTPSSSDGPKAGIGIVPSDMQTVIPSKKVTVHSGEIGGPSAGLMFTLEIFNQITKEDWTKGYRIAGTGTIDADGNVGQIGGIQHKIVAADRSGAEIFFVPKDINTGDSNEKDAFAEAKKINTNMRLVPVGNFNDAIAYLRSLSPHK